MSTINWISFKDVDSRDLNLFIRKKTVHDRAERNLTFISVPGRSGDIVIDNGNFKNINIEYELSLFSSKYPELSENENFFYSWEDVCRWLTEDGKYYRLYSSYDPLYYRQACLVNGLEVDHPYWEVGKFTIAFNCKPYRYRIDGDEIIEIVQQNTVVFNTEAYSSLPYLKIFGSGDIYLHIGGRQYNFLNVSDYVQCDSETMNAYKGAVNKNNDYVGSEYPTLQPGANIISWSGSVDKIQITPRWRTR